MSHNLEQPSNSSKWLVYFASGNFWQGGLTGRHHLLKRISAKGYNVLFVNSLGLASVKAISKNTLFSRVVAKLKSYCRYLKRSDSFLVFSPISIPLGVTALDKLNSFFLKFQFHVMLRLLGIRKPVLLVSSPKAALLLSSIDYSRLIYMYSDKFVSYREIHDRDYILHLDSILKSKSDYIVSNLLKTFEDLSSTEYGSKAKDISAIRHPIVGYYGTLTDSNNWELISYLASMRPEYSFVFIGQVRKDVNRGVTNLPNVHFLGFKEYHTLPAYLKQFDVCIMFWKLTDWIKNSNPLKTKEFLAMGKPIVTVPIYELQRNFGDLVYICTSQNEFLSSIDNALKEDHLNLSKKRIERVMEDSWEKDATKLMDLFEDSSNA